MAKTKIDTQQITDYIPMIGLNRQAIINGNFDVWQRGTSFTGAAPYYSADRWQDFRSAGVGGGTWSRQTAGLNGSLYSIRCQKDSGNSATNTISLAHTLETVDSMKFRGSKLTLSFWAKKGADYSATSSNLAVSISSGTGTDQSQSTGLTNLASIASLTAVLTTSWQKFTVTTGSVVGDTITEIGVRFDETPVGTASTNDWFEITQVQLCAGDVALPFMPKSFDEELRACQRYYWKTFPYNTAVAQNSGTVVGTLRIVVMLAGANYSATMVYFPVSMRATPTITYYNPVAANAKWRNTSDNADSGDATALVSGINSFQAVVNPQVAGDGVAEGLSIHATAESEL